MSELYLCTVALEKNRWAPGRTPSFQVSDLIPDILSGGFDGIELWQYHFINASDEEKAKLSESSVPFYLSTYVSLVNRNEETYKALGDAAKAIKAKGFKFNFGKRPEDDMIDYSVQLENLKHLTDCLPDYTKLICECHPGTIMEIPEIAGEVFEKLDKDRFGAIIHLETAKETADKCFEYYGDRICHIHCQYRNGNESLVPMNDGTGKVKELVEYYSSKGFNGSYAVEFVKFEDNAASHLGHAVADAKYLNTLIK